MQLAEGHPEYGWALNKGYSAPDHVEAVDTARQRQERFVIAHFRLQAREVGGRHVRRVRDDGIEGAGRAGQKVRPQESHPGRDLVAGGVEPRDGERLV